MRQLLILVAIAASAASAACDDRPEARRIPLDQIAVIGTPALRTGTIGGRTNPNDVRVREKLEAEAGPIFLGDNHQVTASYVLVDAENRSPTDAFVTLGGTLTGPGDQTAPLRRESLYVPARGKRTFLLLDEGLAPRPWASGVQVVVTGAFEARHAPAFAIADFNQQRDGDRVVIAANVVSAVERWKVVIVHAAFHDAEGSPIARAHAILRLHREPQTVRFVGPAGSASGTIFVGESADY